MNIYFFNKINLVVVLTNMLSFCLCFHNICGAVLKPVFSVAFNSVTVGLHNTYFNSISLHLLFTLRLACYLSFIINFLTICTKVNTHFIMAACNWSFYTASCSLKEKGREKKQRSPDLEEGTHLIAWSQNLYLFGKTRVLFNGDISSGSEKLIFRCFLFS